VVELIAAVGTIKTGATGTVEGTGAEVATATETVEATGVVGQAGTGEARSKVWVADRAGGRERRSLREAKLERHRAKTNGSQQHFID